MLGEVICEFSLTFLIRRRCFTAFGVPGVSALLQVGRGVLFKAGLGCVAGSNGGVGYVGGGV